MTPATYAKIKAIADDERTDPATREIAWKMLAEAGPVAQPYHKNPLHPGRRQTPEYQAWVRSLNVGKREL